MQSTTKQTHDGFTLVELLVVIVIIASLAALSLTVGPRMMARAKASESMENLRQLSPLMSIYAVDHTMTLPPILGPVTQPDGTIVNQQWNEVCLTLIYPGTDPALFKTKAWWDNNKVILRNPLLKNGWAPLNPGYAMNEMIVENIQAAKTGAPPIPDLLAVGASLASINDPSRTPLIAPYHNFRYRFDDSQIAGFSSGALRDLLVEGKMPVLFVDGHIDVMTPQEYKSRELAKMPLTPSVVSPGPIVRTFTPPKEAWF